MASERDEEAVLVFEMIPEAARDAVRAAPAFMSCVALHSAVAAFAACLGGIGTHLYGCRKDSAGDTGAWCYCLQCFASGHVCPSV